MTSRNLFFNRMKEDRKRRLWTIVLFLCVCLALTIGFEMSLENYITMLEVHSISQKEFLASIYDLTRGGAVPFYLLVCGIGAMLFGFQGFSWLTSKQKVDFYHSLPVTRTEGFLTRYFNGVLMFLIPFAIHSGLFALLLGIRGLLTQAIMWNLISNLGLYFLAFLLLYHIVILAVMMTGNLVVSFLASGTILCYPMCLKLILNWYYQDNFSTITYMDEPFQWLERISPVEQLVGMFQMIMKTMPTGSHSFLIVIFMTGISFILCLWLYKIRPSESAGRALVFPKTESCIRILIVIAVSLISGFFFYVLTGYKSTVWLYLGTIIGAVFCHGFMETIFHFDIKAAFGKKIQLAGTVVGIFLIISTFHFDWLGHDSYFPKKEELKAISYFVEFGGESGSYYTTDEYGNSHYTDLNTIRMEKFRTEKLDQMYALLQAYMTREETEDYNKDFTICYELKNGKKVYRRYYIGRSLLEKYFTEIYESDEYKNARCWMVNLSEKDRNISNIWYWTPFEEDKLEWTSEETMKLIQCYKQDIKEETFHQHLNRKTLGKLTVSYGSDEKESNPGEYEAQFFVPEHYTHTIDYLRSKNINLKLPNDNYEIAKAVIYLDEVRIDAEDRVQMDKVSSVIAEEGTVLTKEQIKDIIPHLIGAEDTRYDSLNNIKYNFRVALYLKNKKTEITSQVDYYMAEENLPESLK